MGRSLCGGGRGVELVGQVPAGRQPGVLKLELREAEQHQHKRADGLCILSKSPLGPAGELHLVHKVPSEGQPGSAASGAALSPVGGPADVSSPVSRNPADDARSSLGPWSPALSSFSLASTLSHQSAGLRVSEPCRLSGPSHNEQPDLQAIFTPSSRVPVPWVELAVRCPEERSDLPCRDSKGSSGETVLTGRTACLK